MALKLSVCWKVDEMFWQRKICVVSFVLSMAGKGNGNYTSPGFRHWCLKWSSAKTN